MNFNGKQVKIVHFAAFPEFKYTLSAKAVWIDLILKN